MATKKNDVKTKNAGTVQVPGGKKITAEGLKGFKDGQELVAFRNDEQCDFEVTYPDDHKGKQHVPHGTTIRMHVLDAAIAEKMGKGKIVKVDEPKVK